MLFRQGDAGNELYIVRRGSVATSISLPDGESREIAVFKSGDFFGEMSIFENAPRSATCTAREDSVLLCCIRIQFSRSSKTTRKRPRK